MGSPALWPIAFALTLVVLAADAGPQATLIYVAPDGNDAWSGSLEKPNEEGTDGPFRTIQRAQRQARELNPRRMGPWQVSILIRGRHFLDEPLVLRPEDSGGERCPVAYFSHGNPKAVLSGGRLITGWRKGEGELWTAQIPEAKAGTWYFRQLFVNGRRATRARTPNKGYLRVTGLVDPKPGAKWNEGVDRFRFKPSDIKPWGDLHNVEVVVFHSWNTSRVRIASVDEGNSIVTFTGPTIFRPLGWDPEQRYYVENARELLDEPGEWYLDRETGTLTYWPLPGEDITKAEVIAPRLAELVRFEGDPDLGLWVEHVRLVRLSFQHADWTLGEKGYGDPQAAVTVPAVISARGTRRCWINGCEVARVGTYGLWLSRGCADNRIEENHIHDLGAGGIRIGEAKMAKTDAAESTRNKVTENYIHDGGHVYAAAVGLWLAHASHNTIAHNEIHSFDYSGMSIGWNWSDCPTRTHHNVIEHNHVHHVVRGVLSDAGGIYTLGRQTGTVIRHNVFHDIFPYMGRLPMAWGIYLDAGSNGLTVESNIVYNTLTGGLMNTGRFGNVFRNNILAHSAWHAAWRYTQEGEPPSIVERNIFYLTQGELFHRDGGRTDFKSRWDRNLYWRADGKPMEFYGQSFEEWQAKGVGAHSMVADPLFADAGRYDFRLKPGSPALKLGFKPIDARSCGVTYPPELVKLVQQATFPPTKLPPVPPPPPPTPVDDGFEKTAVGAPPALATVSVEGKGDSILITDEAAATGKHSLKVTDAPGLKQAWNPHLFYTPHFRAGHASLSFDLRLGKGAIAIHEWRDAAQPYHVGPSLRFEAGRTLVANGTPLVPLPTGQWVRVEIACGLGKQATGHYDLKVTLPGQPARQWRKVACGSAKFRRLEWLGFVSLATGTSAFWLDNVRQNVLDE